ncbi:MAG TPA: C39 family peptidase [Oligoflexus sp.]|uniref:C39 family peptidase n=1 Tax=Oligoflexus sp. TaxID=1971216 RepID=UPI002D41B3F3|nr:C39 family peptidase [Oligoflexus sp.]HYX32533.1 C39 family peptidase [Oligoflexus sp.]
MKELVFHVALILGALVIASCGRNHNESATSQLTAAPSCNVEELKVCLAHAGGNACYAKWSCHAGDESQTVLSVPYYYQLHNQYEPYRSCNITTLAMALSYKTRSIKPDAIYKSYGLVFTGSELAAIGRAYGAQNSTYHAGGVGVAKIKAYLDQGIPVIFQGQFTSGSGHIILIVGYDSSGWIVNDPYGEWYSWGYDHKATVGDHVHYSYDLVDRNSLGGRGNYHITAIY